MAPARTTAEAAIRGQAAPDLVGGQRHQYRSPAPGLPRPMTTSTACGMRMQGGELAGGLTTYTSIVCETQLEGCVRFRQPSRADQIGSG